MAKFLVEIERADGWRKLTTIRIDDNGRRDDEVARDKARLAAQRCLSGWLDYFGPGEKLRIDEEASW